MDQMAWDLTTTSVRAIRTLTGSYAKLQIVTMLPSFSLRFVFISFSRNYTLRKQKFQEHN
jgi:hypothetical protein